MPGAVQAPKPATVQQLGNTNIKALSGGRSGPIPAEQVEVLAIGGNFYSAVVQRLINQHGNNQTASIFVQARGENKVEGLEKENGVIPVDVLNAETVRAGNVAGAISLKEGSSAGCLNGSTGKQELAAALTNLPIQVLCFSLTEAALSPDNSAVIALAEALLERVKTNQEPLHIISTINYKDNASALKDALRGAAAKLNDSANLIDWIDDNLHVHNSAVDRMVWGGPGTEPDPTEAVPYMPLVIERNPEVELPKEFAAMIEESPFCRFTNNLAAWEQQKLFGANAVHTVMASLGLLTGYTVVKESLENDTILAASQAYQERFAIPALEHLMEPPEGGFQHRDFAMGFVERNKVACGMPPGFIHQGSLDIKTVLRISNAVNQLDSLDCIDKDALCLAYALILRANTPTKKTSAKEDVYQVPFDDVAYGVVRGRVYNYLDPNSLDAKNGLNINPDAMTFEVRSELAQKLRYLWDNTKEVIERKLKASDNQILSDLKIPEALHDRIIDLYAQLIADQKRKVFDVVKDTLRLESKV